MSALPRFVFFFFLFLESVLLMLTPTALVEVSSGACALVCAPVESVTVSACWVLGSGGPCSGWFGGGGKLGGAVEFAPPEDADP